MDYTDRHVNLIEEGVDLAIRITGRLGQNEVARRMGTIRMHTVASPDYLARFGRPRHPSELTGHECLGYSMAGTPAAWSYLVDGTWTAFPVDARISASNGEALTEAAAQGLGITIQPDFIVEPALAAGRVVTLLDAFPLPELGIYAMLPSNRQVPHRVRVLIDFLAARIGH